MTPDLDDLLVMFMRSPRQFFRSGFLLCAGQHPVSCHTHEHCLRAGWCKGYFPDGQCAFGDSIRLLKWDGGSGLCRRVAQTTDLQNDARQVVADAVEKSAQPSGTMLTN